MKQKSVIVVMLSLVALILTTLGYTIKAGIHDAYVVFDSDSNCHYVRVSARGHDNEDYLGCSFKSSAGEIWDCKPIKISTNLSTDIRFKIPTQFSNQLYKNYRVSIWDSKGRCKPYWPWQSVCEYCVRNGFHMVGRLDDTGWRKVWGK
jgi:hypothetical protein